MDIGTGAATFASSSNSNSSNSNSSNSTSQSSTNSNTPPPSTQKSQTAPQKSQSGTQSAQSSGGTHKSSSGVGEVTSSQSAHPEVFDVKVNGKIVRMTRDEVLNHASMSHAAHSKFDEAAKLKKQFDRIITSAKSNPIEALMDPSLGLSKDQIRDAFEKWYTQEYIDPETLTPEQLRSRDLETKLKRYEAQEKEYHERTQREQEEKATGEHRTYLQDQIIQALESSGLPKTKFLAQRMAFYMRENLVKGWEAPIGLIVDQVKRERQAIMSDLTAQSDVPTLINLLGEDIINKIRRHDLEQLRARRQFPQTSSQDGYGNADAPGEKVDMSEVTRRLRQLRQGK